MPAEHQKFNFKKKRHAANNDMPFPLDTPHETYSFSTPETTPESGTEMPVPFLRATLPNGPEVWPRTQANHTL